MSSTESAGYVLCSGQRFVSKDSYTAGIGCKFTTNMQKAKVFDGSGAVILFVQQHSLRNTDYFMQEVGRGGLVFIRTL